MQSIDVAYDIVYVLFFGSCFPLRSFFDSFQSEFPLMIVKDNVAIIVSCVVIIKVRVGGIFLHTFCKETDHSASNLLVRLRQNKPEPQWSANFIDSTASVVEDSAMVEARQISSAAESEKTRLCRNV